MDTSKLTFKKVRKKLQPTNGTRSLAARSVRIAYEELSEYCSKPTKKRKSIILKTIDRFLQEDMEELNKALSNYELTDFDLIISSILNSEKSSEEKDSSIQSLIERPEFSKRRRRYIAIKKHYEDLVKKRGEQLAAFCIKDIQK